MLHHRQRRRGDRGIRDRPVAVHARYDHQAADGRLYRRSEPQGRGSVNNAPSPGMLSSGLQLWQHIDMASAPIRNRPRLSVELFRGFLEGRPEEEHWELIDGVAMMMAPPTKSHQRIASNLERLLNDALERHSPALVAYQRVGVNLGPNVQDYDPEPDVTVVEADGD